jgi:hypothetical protein
MSHSLAHLTTSEHKTVSVVGRFTIRFPSSITPRFAHIIYLCLFCKQTAILFSRHSRTDLCNLDAGGYEIWKFSVDPFSLSLEQNRTFRGIDVGCRCQPHDCIGMCCCFVVVVVVQPV